MSTMSAPERQRMSIEDLNSRVPFLRLIGARQDPNFDDGIVRAFWLTLDELRACRERHRSPLLLQCIEDYLAGQRAPLALIHTDASVLQATAAL